MSLAVLSLMKILGIFEPNYIVMGGLWTYVFCKSNAMNRKYVMEVDISKVY